MGHILIKSQHYGNTRTMCDDVNDGWLKLLYIYERRFCFHYVNMYMSYSVFILSSCLSPQLLIQI